MTSIVDFALSKARVFVGILIFIIASGAATYVTIPKESTPDVNIPIIYKSVDWWYSLHQPASLKFTGESAIDASMLYPLLVMIGAFYLLFAMSMLLNMRAELLWQHRNAHWLRQRLDVS